MHLTYKGDYALKAVLDLAQHYDQEVVTIHAIAERIDAPIKFMEQILLDLKRGGFVESRRGRIGGYLLTKAPSQISLGEVVRFIDGPVEPIACADSNYKDCKDTDHCVFRKTWQEVAKCISGIIDNITFENLAEQVQKQKQTLFYQI